MQNPAQAPADPAMASGSIPWSRGRERSRLRMPDKATDCHHHIYDSNYPWTAGATSMPGVALIPHYRMLQERLGTTRNVIVQPSSYGADNRLLLASIAQFGGRARGIAVVNADVTQAQLDALHRGGVRGLRFNLSPPGTTTLAMIAPLAERIARMGWHVQVNAAAAYLLEARSIWNTLPCAVVFDHLAHIPQPDALRHPAFDMVGELLTSGKAYVKLSGLYNESQVGAPTYADSVAVAAAYASAALTQVLWGSDWPHPTEQPLNNIPDDALLLDLLSVAVPDEKAMAAILVDNPARLYQF
jgi:D-galactarolactone isomerase